jgi:hypothetical protein
MGFMTYVWFAALWAAIIYALNCAIAKSFKRIEPKQLVLYVSTVALIGVSGEIFLDTFYKLIAGHPLWYYNVLPVKHGYTSSYAIVIWGLYGFHLYLLHGSLAAKWSITRTRHLALIFCLEALLLEALLTLSARLFFGTYMYYYLPADLWHVTSIQNIPFYFICGVVLLKTLKRFRTDPVFFTLMNSFLIFVLIFLT